MSHFSEGGKGVATDPKQRTLSNFIVTDGASGRGLGDQALSESNISDDTLAIGRDTSFSSDTHEQSELIDFVDTYQMPESEHTDTRHCHNEAETPGSLDLQIDDFNNNVRILICFFLEY